MTETEETIELGIFARMTDIGRTIVFMMLKENGWLDRETSKPLEWTVEQGYLTQVTKYCQSPKYSTTKFLSTHITAAGRYKFFNELPYLVSNIVDEGVKARVSARVCKAGFSDLLRIEL